MNATAQVAASTVQSALPSLDATVGAAFLGLIFSAILFGVNLLQVYIYYREYPNDWKLYRFSVLGLWTLDAFHLSLTIHAVYYYLINEFGQFLSLQTVVWSFKVQIAINIVIIVAVQMLYTVRIWKLGKHFYKALPWVVMVFVAAGAAVGIAVSYKTANISTFAELDGMAWAVDTSFAVATFIDLVIALTMCYYLQLTRSSTEFSGTNTKIGVLIRFVLVSGLATSACSMACLICYLAMPTNLIFIGIEFLLTKLYVVSFLSMLNARKRISGNGSRGAETTSSNHHTTSHSNNQRVLRITTVNAVSENGQGKQSFIPLTEMGTPSAEEGKWRHPDAERGLGGYMA
ncbi:hypothetical protein CYLTODRAFT_369465 [Cylindrobasidium torrendii FP15055 ss-10]|uniref:DUF6534 domain-containing protein n=1 Tax=Cylindrobasidium torrendii FP15055 ss-10 TaxID=1314674 RepID=A0A0D7BLN2_9AGAR|nr:hypothetical protein CYLTODRAFT_369465 [Cylindrobasidium torrendii FP15055 ss-10]